MTIDSFLQRLIVAALLTTAPISLQANPVYASSESKRVIENMVNAHGGLERWKAAPSIRYDAVMHNNYHGKQELAWWVQHEVIDQKTRQVVQNWTLDKAQIGFDGNDVWTVNWNRANPPTMMVHFFYYFVNLPWLTQDDGVELGEPKPFTWPGLNKELIEVSMTFTEAPTVGKTGKDYFVLYIDPQTWQLFGYQYGIGYKPFLDMMNMPEGKDTFGPLWRLITSTTDVNGLVFPSAFRTMPEADERIVGNHVILNIDIGQPFDAEKAQKPANAVVDGH